MKIVISPYSQPLKNGKRNSKNYSYWQKVVSLLKDKGHHIVQIGRSGEELIKGVDEVKHDLPLKELKKLLLESDTFISVDNFLPHFCNLFGKRGIVIFSKSDPKIFGYTENKNLYKHEKYFRKYQFSIWEEEEYDQNAFIIPQRVVESL